MIVGIIQARLGSTRLPGKVLKPILGKPMLALMLERVKQAKMLDQIVVATTNLAEDQPIVDLAAKEGFRWFRGSSNDVLDRYYRAADHFGAQTVVRLTADCPLQDPAVIDLIVRRWEDAHGTLDFLSNVHPPTFPDGLDTEVFSFAALKQAREETKLPAEREHVTPYFYATGKFRTGNVEHVPNLSGMRWTVDYAEDFALVEGIFHALYKPDHVFGMDQIVSFVNGDGKKFVGNTQYSRNPWYQTYQKKIEIGS